jgi:hypothetical protein
MCLITVRLLGFIAALLVCAPLAVSSLVCGHLLLTSDLLFLAWSWWWYAFSPFRVELYLYLSGMVLVVVCLLPVAGRVRMLQFALG